MAATEAPSSLEATLSELDRIAPDAPLLALGQTVLWDEPMKGGVALLLRDLGSKRKFVAGVHDTDFFAKLPSAKKSKGRFAAVPHNDTTTRGLWSAAGEFSALFGSETVITKQDYLKAGLRLAAVLRNRPNVLDEASEAWRWRGIVTLDEEPILASEVPLDQIFSVLQSTLDWAIEETIGSLGESEQARAREIADRLHSLVCDGAEQEGSENLTGFYRNLLTKMYAFVAGEEVPLQATMTSELLRFNSKTAGLARFELAGLFLKPDTKLVARTAYDEAIRGSEIYDLSRFGTGAIPFDLVIPGKGRGTLRIGNRGAVIMTRQPQFLSFKKPIVSVEELAAAVEAKFGPDCVLIGKAVTLIGMLAREFVFVFHEGASSYVKYTRRFHDLLAGGGCKDRYNPILRLKYGAWSALQSCCGWLKLPDPLREAFGTEEPDGPSFASRWREVAKNEQQKLAQIAQLRGPLDLIRYLAKETGESWESLAAEYQDLHKKLEGLAESVRELAKERRACYGQLRQQKQARVDAEKAKGEHFRAKIFEKEPGPKDLKKREELGQEVDHAVRAVEETKGVIAELLRRQETRVSDPKVQEWHSRRRSIELEAELKRMRLVRQAIIASKGLERAGFRPSGWWFPMVCPSGNWFKNTVRTADAYLEPLVSKPISAS